MRKISGNLTVIKKLNKQSVLSIIQDSGPLSRADIAKKAKLNKATVSTLIDELLQTEIIKEIGEGESSGGRKPILLTVNDDSGCILGVDLQVNHIAIMLTNLNGKALWSEKRSIPADASQATTLQEMDELILKGIALAPVSPLGILGIGIAVPGIVNHSNGELLMAPNLHWNNLSIKTHFEKLTSLPIFVDNEANVAALSERTYGSGKDCNNLVYISAGVGIGVGIIIKGELYHGSQGYSGELGHMSIESNGLKCPCGNRGCWEMYASEKALMSKIASKHRSFSDLVNNHQMEDDAIIALNEIGTNLGIGITNIIHAFDPEVVILGNTLAEAGDLLLHPIKKTVEDRRMAYVNHQSEIKLTELGEHSRTLGASAMVTAHLFNNYTSVLFQ